jgi:LysR family glycine cleavage system transcriptional activator
MRAPGHLNALRAFESAARHCSYIRAAEELNVSPAAVGQLIRGLEDAYNVILFHRSRSGPARLVLTEVALSILLELQGGFDLLGAAVETLKTGGAMVCVNVTSSPAFADKWLLQRVESFQILFPQYELRLDSNIRLVNFATERVDLGIRFGGGQWPGLVSTHLMSDEFFPVCSPSLLLDKHPLTSIEALAFHPLLHDVSMRDSPEFLTWKTWLQNIGHVHEGVERGLQINNSATVIQSAICGGGVALSRRSLVSADLAAGRLVRPFGEAQPSIFSFYIVAREGIPISAAAQAFKDWLMGQASNEGLLN